MLLTLCVGCSVKKTENMCHTCVRHIDAKFRNITEEGGDHPSIVRFTDKKTNLIGFKEKNGKVIIPPQYKGVYDFNIYGVTDVFDDNSWYKITTNNMRLVKSYMFDNGPDYYVSGLSRFEKDGKLGFVNVKGEIVITPQFDWATGFWFSEPIAIVCVGCTLKKAHENDQYPTMKGGKWGGIDKKGHLITPLDFTDYEIDKDRYLLLLKNEVPYKICQIEDGMFQSIKQ